jgi:hypothetical protein
MNDSLTLAIWIAAIGIIAGVVAAVVIAPRVRATRHDTWRRFARRHRFSLHEDADGADRIEGTMTGRRVIVRRTDVGSDAELVGLATVRIELMPRLPPPRGLTVVNAGEPVGRVAHLLDAHVADPVDVKSTDPEFHLVVRQSGSAPDALQFLTRKRRRALQDLADRADQASVGIQNEKLFWEDRDSPTGVEYLEQRLSLLQETAERLEAADDPPDLIALSETLTAQGRTE